MIEACNITMQKGKILKRCSFPETVGESKTFSSTSGSINTCNFSWKEALVQVFFCKFCWIFKNTFVNRTPPVTASVFQTIGNIFKNRQALKPVFPPGICLPVWEITIYTPSLFPVYLHWSVMDATWLTSWIKPGEIWQLNIWIWIL